VFPKALYDFVGFDADDVPWRTRMPGFKEYDMGEIEGCHVNLFWIKPGRTVPAHTHEGSEFRWCSTAISAMRAGITDAVISRWPTTVSITGRMREWAVPCIGLGRHGCAAEADRFVPPVDRRYHRLTLRKREIIEPTGRLERICSGRPFSLETA
jgi:hypothetical protein